MGWRLLLQACSGGRADTHVPRCKDGRLQGPRVVPWLRVCAHGWGRVESLIRELRPHMPHGPAKNK